MIDWDSLINECKKELEAMGFEWIECIHTYSHKMPTIRIYLDRRDRGFTIDDATVASNYLVPWFTVRLPENVNFHLEVSSPGIDRPIRYLWQFQKNINRILQVSYLQDEQPTESVGKLISADENNLCLIIEKKEKVIPFQSVIEGKVIFQKISTKNVKGKRR